MKVIAMNNVPVKLWVDQLDAHAWEEVNNLTTLPFLFHHLALMPDAHGGKGMPIGGVLATKGVVIPNAVGVDIGCGMCAVKTNLLVEEIPQDVLRKEIMRGIRKRIPLGREHHKAAQDEQYMPTGFDTEKMTVVNRQLVSARKQIGTLGGGNHFIELQRCNDGYLWIMLHSGRRLLQPDGRNTKHPLVFQCKAGYKTRFPPAACTGIQTILGGNGILRCFCPCQP